MAKRLLIYAAGVLLLGFGIVLNTKAGLGVGSVTTLSYAVSEMTPLTLGTVTTLMYFGFVAAQLAIYRKFSVKVLLQLPFSYLMGHIIDFYDNLLDFTVDSLGLGLGLLAAAIVCTALAAYVVVAMDLIPNPADGMARAVGYAVHMEFGRGKLIFDCVMVAVTAVVSLVFAHRIIGIGLGTVLSALCIGRLIQSFGRSLGPYMDAVLAESRRRDREAKKLAA